MFVEDNPSKTNKLSCHPARLVENLRKIFFGKDESHWVIFIPQMARDTPPLFLVATSGGLSVHAICIVSLSLGVEGHLPYLSGTDKLLNKAGER